MLIRFLLSIFTIIVVATATFATGLDGVENMKNNNLVITFDSDRTSYDWQVINDSVMGGLSVGRAQRTNQSLIFSGQLSTENNGGFTSIYTDSPKLPEYIKSVNIRIKGDGNCYQLRMRSQEIDEQIVYKIEFDTEVNKLETLSFKLHDFKASFRGRIINNAPVLKADEISQLGFLIVNKDAREFTLSIDEIEFY